MPSRPSVSLADSLSGGPMKKSWLKPAELVTLNVIVSPGVTAMLWTGDPFCVMCRSAVSSSSIVRAAPPLSPGDAGAPLSPGDAGTPLSPGDAGALLSPGDAGAPLGVRLDAGDSEAAGEPEA